MPAKRPPKPYNPSIGSAAAWSAVFERARASRNETRRDRQLWKAMAAVAGGLDADSIAERKRRKKRAATYEAKAARQRIRATQYDRKSGRQKRREFLRAGPMGSGQGSDQADRG